MTILVANTNLVILTGYSSHVEGVFIDDATVEVTVTDENGEAVAGASWPLAMDHVADSDGVYRAVLPDTLPLVARKTYVAVVTADGGAGRKAEWRVKFEPEIRRK